jgi:hypothetical protein
LSLASLLKREKKKRKEKMRSRTSIKSRERMIRAFLCHSFSAFRPLSVRSAFVFSFLISFSQRTVIEKARILLITANLSKRLWPKTLTTTCFLSNRFFIKTLDDKTLYETWHDEKLDLSNLRMYDCKAYVMNYHVKKKNKMIKRAWIDTLINYEIKNQWRIYDEKSVFIWRDVIFNEVKMTYKNFVEKSKLLLDSLYLRYKNNDSFRSVKNDDDNNDQLVRIDQSVKKRKNSDSKNSNH